MKPNAPVIGIDLDDVLWDLLEAWINRYDEITDDNVKPSDIKSWDVSKYINKGSKEMLFYILEQSDFWETVNPRPESQKYLKQLIDDGYDVVIITASHYKTLNHKMSRFFDLFPFIEKEQVIVAHRKQMIDIDLLIDDNPENLRDSSYIKVLFDTPHNEWLNEKEIGAIRLSNWKEIYEYIVEKLPVRG